MKRLRIAMLIQCYHPLFGGAEKQLKSLVPFLQKEDCEIHILTRRRNGLDAFEMVDDAHVHRIRVMGPKAFASATFTLGSFAKLSRIQPHILHAHELLSPTTTAVIAKRNLGIPVVAKVLGGGNLGDISKLRNRTTGNRRISIFRKWVDKFIVVSREIDRELASIGIPEDKRCLLPNGVDTERFFPADAMLKHSLRKKMQLAGNPIGVFTGRLAPEKNVDELVRIWSAIQANDPSALLVIVGDGSEEQRLRSLAGKGVRFIGAVPDVVPYLQAADLFVLPSNREGLSNSMLEAMSCGLTIVAKRVGGAPDVVRSGENGFLVDPNGVQDFHDCVLKIVQNSELRKVVGERARETIVQHYSIASTAKRLRSLYDSLLQ